MHNRKPSWRGLALVAMGLFAGLLLACTTPAGPVDAPTPIPITPTETRPVVTVTITSTAPITPAAPITLTVWTTPLFAPGEQADASRILAAQASAFTEAYPDYRLDWVTKPLDGAGGIVDFLLAAQEVAPGILPDIVVLDTRDLGTLARSGLLQPLDGLIAEDIRTDQYSFARTAGLVDAQWYGLAFESEIEHLIYNSNSVDAPPLTWSDVLSDSIRYAFPAGGVGDGANDALLLQYVTLGGRLSNENGEPALDEKPLAEVLAFYANGIKSGTFPTDVLELKTPEETLAVYEAGRVSICNVSSSLYLTNRDRLRNTAFATIPTWNGTVATIGRGHAWGLVAPDPTRQVAAKAFLEWFMDAKRMADWTRSAGRLPTRQSAMSQWKDEDTYVAFVGWQLASAYSIPPTSEYHPLYAAMQRAVRDVLTNTATPAEAARQAVAALAPG